ncbi:hypothetical protein M3J09_013060 [Ascochyta lentis]
MAKIESLSTVQIYVFLLCCIATAAEDRSCDLFSLAGC